MPEPAAAVAEGNMVAGIGPAERVVCARMTSLLVLRQRRLEQHFCHLYPALRARAPAAALRLLAFAWRPPEYTVS